MTVLFTHDLSFSMRSFPEIRVTAPFCLDKIHAANAGTACHYHIIQRIEWFPTESVVETWQ
jgi:hypothetical protein